MSTTTQSQAHAALAAIAALSNAGPGRAAHLARLNTSLANGDNGTDPGAYAQIVIEVNRYLANPV
jgi:hypothetical protein